MPAAGPAPGRGGRPPAVTIWWFQPQCCCSLRRLLFSRRGEVGMSFFISCVCVVNESGTSYLTSDLVLQERNREIPTVPACCLWILTFPLRLERWEISRLQGGNFKIWISIWKQLHTKHHSERTSLAFRALCRMFQTRTFGICSVSSDISVCSLG